MMTDVSEILYFARPENCPRAEVESLWHHACCMWCAVLARLHTFRLTISRSTIKYSNLLSRLSTVSIVRGSARALEAAAHNICNNHSHSNRNRTADDGRSTTTPPATNTGNNLLVSPRFVCSFFYGP